MLSAIMLKFVLGLLAFGLVQANPAFRDEPIGVMNDIKGSVSRVTGGWPAQDGQFPYQVSIRMVDPAGFVASCGGSILDHEWILTSAHCLAHRISYLVRLGTTDIRRPAFVLEHTDKDAILHPDYDLSLGSRVQQNDIALLKLSLSLPYGPNIQPIRLQNSQQKNINYAGKVLVVSGFGYDDETWNGGTESDILLWTYLRGMSNEDCLTYYTRVYPSTVCARFYNSTDQSACYGDSGGPLTIQDEDGKVTMVGIVHYGTWRGCTSVWPTGYVRPGHYLDWITQTTGIETDWSFPDPEDNLEQF